jgi:hypothetical protein
VREEFKTVKDDLSVKTAVFEGGYISATNAKCNKDDDTTPNTQTIWGELAYQLAGADGYAKFSDYDDRIVPGESDIDDLFE